MRLVIIGFGYSAQAFAREIRREAASIHVTARVAETCARHTAEGWDAIAFDGGHCPPALERAIGAATHLAISAPPGEAGDPAINACRAAIRAARGLRHILYLSTIGVYGDHEGRWIDETAPVIDGPDRNGRRVLAERAWQALAAEMGAALAILRLGGIYGPGRNAIENLRAGTARRIIKPGQVFNRIHVADIAGALAALVRGHGAYDLYNLVDDEPAPPQDVIAYAASLAGLPVPPEVPFDEAALSPMGRSFYARNKRVSNARIKRALAYGFRYPTYREGLAACL